jgi:uncharacterized membrane protein
MVTMAGSRGALNAGLALLVAGLLVSVAGFAWSWFAVGSGASGTWESWAGASRLPLLVAGLVIAAIGAIAYLRGLRTSHLTPATFLEPEDEERVLAAIRAFEKRTSGEIRVHLSDRVRGDVMQAAQRVFEELGMTATAERNGVLFFVAVPSRRFAVLGDSGIDDAVEEGFWSECVARVRERFAEERYADGLVEGIRMAGEKLAEVFPYREDDVNELDDSISRG